MNLPTNPRFIIVLAFLSIGLLLTACDSSSDGGIEITDTWGRPSPSAATTGAFYMIIKNNANQADRLVGASSPACGMVQVHETSMSDDGVMSMSHMEHGIEIPAQSKVELKPGGLHVMCTEKKVEFATGSSVPLTLQFENSGEQTLDIPIREP